MKESRIYSFAMLAGIIIPLTGLLIGIALHSWLAVAGGAMIAGVGGVIGMLAAFDGR